MFSIKIAPIEFNFAVVTFSMIFILFLWFIPCFKFLITKRTTDLRMNIKTTQAIAFSFQTLALLLMAVIALDLLSWISPGTVGITYRNWEFRCLSSYAPFYLVFLVISSAILWLWWLLLTQIRSVKQDSDKIEMEPLWVVMALVIGPMIGALLVDRTMESLKIFLGPIQLTGVALLSTCLFFKRWRSIVRVISGIMIIFTLLDMIAFNVAMKCDVFSAASHCDGFVKELERIREKTGSYPEHFAMEGLEHIMCEGETWIFHKSNRVRYISNGKTFTFIIYESCDLSVTTLGPVHCYSKNDGKWRSFDIDSDLSDEMILSDLGHLYFFSEDERNAKSASVSGD